MAAFWKAAAMILLAIILGVSIGKTERDISVVLTMTVCCGVGVIAVQYLSPTVDFLRELADKIGMDAPFASILLKISGIAIVTELTGMIGADAGNSSLGKVMQILGNSLILYLALPLFDAFFTLIQEILAIL